MASDRIAWGKAELADEIRVLDGQRFLEVLPLTNSVVSEELTIAEPQPNVLNSASSSMTCISGLILIRSSITSPHSGAPHQADAHIRVILRKTADVARVIK